MKKLNFVCALLCACLLMVSCGKKSAQQGSADSSVEVSTVMTVDSLFQQAAALTDSSVEVEGICTHICAHGGRKIFLMGSDDTQVIRVEATEQIGKFKQECVNSVVRVKGTLVEDRIDEAYLQEWEASVAAAEAEKHGEGESGCSTEKKARGEKGNSVADRIADFRAQIAERAEKEGKNYLSFYHIDGASYEVVE